MKGDYMEDKILQAALAGLLHDVGKFSHRTGKQIVPEWSDGRTRDGFGYQHAFHTWQFTNQYLPSSLKQVGEMAALHHRPNGRGIAVQLADILAAGGSHKEELDDGDRERHPRQLQSIFQAVFDYKKKAPDKKYLPLEYFRLAHDVVFPNVLLPDEKAWDQYRMLWGDFCSEAETLKKTYDLNGNLETYLEAMLALMQSYAWRVPSAYFDDEPDISLYDHSRMTAALAAVLIEFSNDQLEQMVREPETNDEVVASLIGGDISGVQDFIYTITSKGATSALRGRSFYLQLLTEAVVRFVLDELELPATNIIYAGGGNFYILARALDLKKLPVVQQKISRLLYKHHGGDLYLALAGAEIKAKEFMGDANTVHPLSRKWSELARRQVKVKNRRFSELEQDEFKEIFKPIGHGGNQDGECIVCGREFSPSKDQQQKCPDCDSYENLGDELRNAKYIIWQRTGNIQGNGWRKVLGELGYQVLVLRDSESVPSEGLVWALDDEAYSSLKHETKGTVVRRLVVNVTPRLDENFTSEDGQVSLKGGIKPFEKLAKDSKGIKRLGILRADVDNLGHMFAEGLGAKATLSRIASLSFAVSLYFEGWVGYLAQRRNEENGQSLYAIYSGGDDLFFVGAWDEIVEFAREIRNDLVEYVIGHPNIHLSAGVVLVNDKYPLARAAEDAAGAEEQAKKFEWWNEKGKTYTRKNVISFLGQPLAWETFEKTRSLMSELVGLDDGVRKSTIHTLLENYALYAETVVKRRDAGRDKNQQGQPQVDYGPWNWRILYMLNRNLNDKDLMEKFRSNPAMLEWLGVAARWAELLTRNEKGV
jgi:CRISPR-associated protein Csm1